MLNNCQLAGIKAIEKYLDFKYDSGLLYNFRTIQGESGTKFFLQSTWGTYQRLVLPEILSLCHEHGLWALRHYTQRTGYYSGWAPRLDKEGSPEDMGNITLLIGGKGLSVLSQTLAYWDVLVGGEVRR
jgi:hypothetical protein